MKLLLLAVGRLKDAWVVDGCEEYLKRLRRHVPTSIVEVRDATGLRARIPERTHVVALDEHGPEPTSTELARKLAHWMNQGKSAVAFLVGGADGLPTDLLERADERLSLSRLTLPHRLARLVLLEQLYRAMSIVRNEPYHRA
jgi:23S rRNA (pseudouridine1915-N3)-methyltransferase